MKIFQIKSGFTLAEVMVCFAVIGVIASVALPIINTKKPPSNRILFKKAYSTVERVVYELVHDSDLYPDKDGCSGLDNTDSITYDGIDYAGTSKFRQLFAQKVNVSTTSGTNIVTMDGVIFTIPNTDFPTDLSIVVDVNGDKGPNALDPNAGVCDNNRDRFTIIVEANGRVSTNGACAREYLGDVNFNAN